MPKAPSKPKRPRTAAGVEKSSPRSTGASATEVAIIEGDVVDPALLADASDWDKQLAHDPEGTRRLWGYSERFGRYLQELRGRSNLSLRKVAERVNISHTYLSVLESEPITTPPSLELLAGLALIYGVRASEMQKAAGYRYEVRRDIATILRGTDEDRFRALMLGTATRPLSMEERDLEIFGPRHRQLLFELADAVDANARCGGQSLSDAILGARMRHFAATQR